MRRILVVPVRVEGHADDPATLHRQYCERLPAYIEAASLGQVALEVTLAAPVVLPRPIDEYRVRGFRISELRSDPGPQRRLVGDAARLVDRDHDLSVYDGLMLAVHVPSRLLGRRGFLFRSPSGFGRMAMPSGRRIPPTDVHTVDTPLPSLAYALPKMLAGYRDRRAVAPTLYDYAAQSTPGPYVYANQYVGGTLGMQYISPHAGPWDILSQHGIRTADGIEPQGMTSFTRWRLGWLPSAAVVAVQAGERREIVLAPLAAGIDRIRALRLPLADGRYVLIEHRRRIGVDRHLPAEGVLVLQVDENVPEGQGPVRVVDADPGRPYLAGAPFAVGNRWRDDVHGIELRVLEESGGDVRIVVDRTGAVAHPVSLTAPTERR